jgi:oxalate decarboxylase/phosphoglucose isomerase-like protein (cupin superfamily)
MSDPQRRAFLAAAGIASLAALGGTQPAAGGDPSFMNNVPDPTLAGKDLPTFKFALEKSDGKVIGSSYGKEATVAQLPISKGIAGVSMRLEPGAMRELHWHATAAEWAFVLEGRVRTTVVDPGGLAETNDFEPGDVWYFPRGHGHMLQCVGDKPCHFILIFDNGYFSEFGTFSVTDWVGHTPPALLAKNFGLPEAVFATFPKEDEWQYIVEGEVSVTLFGSHGRYRIERLQKGDVGYIPQGYGHSIENVGSGPARILIGFNAGIYETIDLSQWIAANPKDVLATNFGQPVEVFEKFPDRDVFIARKDGAR